MVATFPNMGNVAIGAATLCQGLEIPYVMPEANNKKTIERGAFYSPEEICLPFKLVMGNLIECMEKGADTVLTSGSCGPCRFGEYCELQMKILRKMGYRDVDFVVVDFSSEIGWEEFKRRIGKVTAASPVSTIRQVRALQTAYQAVDLCDRLDARAYELAGYEANEGECRRLLYAYREQVRKCKTPEETVRLLKSYRKKFDHVKTDQSKDPLQIAIIGELFTVIDPFTNLYIEEKLMEYGVSTKRMLSPSWWVRDLMLKPVKLNSYAINSAAREYLNFNVGGHGKECVGEAVLAGKHGMDGAIQILPLGCMPEVVAKSILPAIQRDKDFPIMTLIVDEVTGEAGYITRVEAFLDMLISRKRQGKEKTAPAALSAFGGSSRRRWGV